jgi:long-chain acyl-CoA synthetase
VLRRFEKTFNCLVIEGYGLSESTCRSTFNPPDQRRRPGSCGLPIGNEMRVVDDDDRDVPDGKLGEIVLRGENILKGYFKNEAATATAFRNGWFHTGDIGVMDREGYLSIVDRKKDMILRGGYNIYPRELEEVIITHPAISLCAVIGVPDEKLGEEVKAFIVLKQGAEISKEDFKAWCKTQMAANKYPRYVEFRDELPIGRTGKIQKLALKEESASA